VQREAYLLELARYVVLNRLRAGICVNTRLGPWFGKEYDVGYRVFFGFI
jgi:hypothetical protein